MKIITNSGGFKKIFEIEIAGMIAWFVTALFLFVVMWVATKDLFASLFFPIEMVILFIIYGIVQIFKFYWKR